MKKHWHYLGFIALLSFTACIPLLPEESPTPTPVTDDWKALANVTPELSFKALHATPFELYAITDNQFIRIGEAQNLVEQRTLQVVNQYYGLPAMSDNVFARIGLDPTDSRKFIEFHLTKNGNEVRKVSTKDFVAANESFEPEVNGRSTGVFSADGTKFFLPGTVFNTYKPAVVILNVNLNAATNYFSSITLAKKVDLPNLNAGQTITSMRFIDNACYLATAGGGYRVALDGTVRRLFPDWVVDFFKSGNVIYATGYASSIFYFSVDGGTTWTRSAQPSTLRYVEVAGKFVFTQEQMGKAFELADSTLNKSVALRYNKAFQLVSTESFTDIVFFKNNYYTNYNKQIFYNPTPTKK